ncbi:uncharacterized protein EI97DRAFT_214778 [Westerdykella ornata]|uniref:Uncharacterized protein n=1 Tax=Westerdykella ornata TaxID=318751 RepID=A0A6A6JR74_WESOR|nr:uncharacterized protein EI97DRAFT_214778 [Westerdykella ornata]KAF2278603.1 hypothetical protein EI97DRAFT_214778 [Westerdykella ornata]
MSAWTAARRLTGRSWANERSRASTNRGTAVSTCLCVRSSRSRSAVETGRNTVHRYLPAPRFRPGAALHQGLNSLPPAGQPSIDNYSSLPKHQATAFWKACDPAAERQQGVNESVCHYEQHWQRQLVEDHAPCRLNPQIPLQANQQRAFICLDRTEPHTPVQAPWSAWARVANALIATVPSPRKSSSRRQIGLSESAAGSAPSATRTLATAGAPLPAEPATRIRSQGSLSLSGSRSSRSSAAKGGCAVPHEKQLQ